MRLTLKKIYKFSRLHPIQNRLWKKVSYDQLLLKEYLLVKVRGLKALITQLRISDNSKETKNLGSLHEV